MTLTKEQLRKIILAIILLLLAVLVGIAGFNFFTSRDVSFTLSSNTTGIDVYAGDQGKELNPAQLPPRMATLDKSGSLRLKPGTYYAIPTGDKIDKSPIKFIVNDNSSSIAINPYFSRSYLQQAFYTDTVAINQLLTKTYRPAIDSFIINSGIFHHFGDWYTTTLQSKSPASQDDDIQTYGVILKRDGNTWKIAAAPSISFTYVDNKDIPKDIIDTLNQVVSNY